jgi:hypothetical protein
MCEMSVACRHGIRVYEISSDVDATLHPLPPSRPSVFAIHNEMEYIIIYNLFARAKRYTVHVQTRIERVPKAIPQEGKS